MELTAVIHSHFRYYLSTGGGVRWDDLLHSLCLPWFQLVGMVRLTSYSKDLHILPPCSGLFPHAILFLRRAPVIGHLLNLPGIKTVSSL